LFSPSSFQLSRLFFVVVAVLVVVTDALSSFVVVFVVVFIAVTVVAWGETIVAAVFGTPRS